MTELILTPKTNFWIPLKEIQEYSYMSRTPRQTGDARVYSTQDIDKREKEIVSRLDITQTNLRKLFHELSKTEYDAFALKLNREIIANQVLIDQITNNITVIEDEN